MPRSTIALLLSAILALPAGADERHVNTLAEATSPAQASYDYAQTVRNEVRASLKENPDRPSLEQAAQRLDQLAAWLDTPLPRELGTGSRPLYFRGVDVQRDLAAIHVRLGNTGKALDALETMQRYAWLGEAGAMILGDGAFAPLRGEPRFQAILQTTSTPSRMLKDFGADSPYRERLSVEERIAGLTQFWSDAREYFVHFDNAPQLDWNKTYLEFLPRVMAAETTFDYYRVLMQLAPLLRDGHTNIFAPQELQERFDARPPIVTELVGDTVLVIAVNSTALAGRLKVGDELVAVDGVPVKRHAEEKVAPFVSSSTPQDHALRTYSYQLLSGDAAEPVRLTLRDSAGRLREESVARGPQDLSKYEKFGFRMLAGDVAYLSLDHFDSDEGVKAFTKALPQIMRAKGLVIDVRRNGGGSTAHGERILEHLTRQAIPRAMSFMRGTSIVAGHQARLVAWEPVARSAPAHSSDGDVYEGPVAVLTGAATFSAAEDFVLAFNALKRGATIGATTGGSTGQPMNIRLPGGGWGRICIKRDLLPDGGTFVGRGLKPDIEAGPTVQSIRKGGDPVLERALAHLKSLR
ncbi:MULTISPECIES: S41 family peptidase [Massilia]|uniref:S41 family peptidase n=1 Tax=Massilia TaxID=149698 RepID=UPI000F2DDBB1|nr:MULTISPECIES: S41 family peptidase [Massilia]MDY0962590.1 S41 family peptidase [Massilia sp. CFBP9026]